MRVHQWLAEALQTHLTQSVFDLLCVAEYLAEQDTRHMPMLSVKLRRVGTEGAARVTVCGGFDLQLH
jgi:hypothetical protein